MRQARWIELEGLTPRALHAAYLGLAEAQPEGAAPIVLWARCDRPHVSLSETRSPSLELDLAACRALGIEVIVRPLGGGAVLVDAWQQALFFILPLGAGPPPPPRVFIRRCLEPLARTYRRFGIAAEVSGGTDIAAGGVKLSGSGAATLGASLVFGSSFVQRFDYDLFCRVIRVPSEGFRLWLRAALEQGFRAWPQSPAWPGAQALRAALRSELEAGLGWRCEDDEPRRAERSAIARAREALEGVLEEGEEGGRRHVPGGVKINAGMFLTETSDERGGWLRVLTRAGRIERLAAQDEALSLRLQSCLGRPPEASVLVERLASAFARAGEAEYWARRIEAAAATEER